MKRGNNIISIFFIIWGAGALLLLTRDIRYDLLKMTLYSLAASIIITPFYVVLRRPLMRLYRRNFDKNYKYSMDRPKKK